MKKEKYGTGAKLVATVLLCLSALLFLGSLLGVLSLSRWGAYTDGYETALRRRIDGLGQEALYNIRNEFFDRGRRGAEIYPYGNLRFSVVLDSGEVLYSSETDEEALWSGSIVTEIPPYWRESDVRAERYTGTAVTPTPAPTPRPVPLPTGELPTTTPRDAVVTPTPAPAPRPAEDPDGAEEETRYAVIHARVSAALREEDGFSLRVRSFRLLYRLRYAVVAALALSVLFGLLLFVWLLKAAGRRGTDGTVVPGWADRIPYELFTLLCAGLFCLPILILNQGFAWDLPGFLLFAGMALLSGLVLLFFCMSTAVRIKTRTLGSGLLLTRLLRWLSDGFRRLLRFLAALLRQLPVMRRVLLLVLAFCFLEGIVLSAVVPSHERGDIIFFLLVKDVLLLGVCCWLLSGVQRLRDGAAALASGDLNMKIRTEGLVPALREHAEDLNRISEGMNTAVEERLKSERLRTELITNVSHDIKTPLTSIINYVDLLSKTEPENETVREYLEVLSRQSAKLKKLIEDLIEASKASSGNLPVCAEACDLTVLLHQVSGEYAERLQAAALTPVVSCPDAPVFILADGRHMWRIMDNLLNNICKYAQPGTRVYLSLDREGGDAVMIFRNISRDPLNSSADELTERFARGDRSRSTEGNGLGLSIADSLVKLQNGQMRLVLDGDLFKVRLSFPLLRAEEMPGTEPRSED